MGNNLSDYRFDLPPGLIAQCPLASRSASRLLVLDGALRQHRRFRELPSLLMPGDHLIFNDTRVVPARLHGRKATGGRIELMLERFLDNGRALVKLRSSKSPKPGAKLEFEVRESSEHAERRVAGKLHENAGQSMPGRLGGKVSDEGLATQHCLTLEVVGRHDDLYEVANASETNSLADFLDRHGDIPLPPYIERAPDAADVERYQTIYAREPGAVAAPTAGLHFDDAILSRLAEQGVTHDFVTLHVGAGTFQPVRVADPSTHVMHAERVSVPGSAVDSIARTRAAGGRVIAVGTTSVRALESAAVANCGELAPYFGETRLFLTPGSRFHVIDAMITNFHLPESTLLMLVAAFAGLDDTLAAYREAVAERYRFFSYGDAMLVWPQRRTSNLT